MENGFVLRLAAVREVLWGAGDTTGREATTRGGTPWWILDQTCCLYRDKPEHSAMGSARASKSRSEGFPAPRGEVLREAAESGPSDEEDNSSSAVPSARAQSSPSKPPARGGAAKCCDRCDGPHDTDSCPHFRKPREKHVDAWSNLGKGTTHKNGEAEKPIILKRGRGTVIRQPGDGSCLFHSLNHGLGGGSASTLRREICGYIAENPDAQIADTSLREWVEYDSGSADVKGYAAKMSSGSWGGGIEMAVLSLMKGVNVHVYESHSSGYVRISSFDAPRGRGSKAKEAKTINVLYQGRSHYDALDLG